MPTFLPNTHPDLITCGQFTVLILGTNTRANLLVIQAAW
jgi:hypothetical protein